MKDYLIEGSLQNVVLKDGTIVALRNKTYFTCDETVLTEEQIEEAINICYQKKLLTK